MPKFLSWLAATAVPAVTAATPAAEPLLSRLNRYSPREK